MSSVTIRFRDGTERVFEHEGRAGGSYTKTVKYEDGVVIVKDEWDKRTAFPLDLVAEIVETPNKW